MLHLLYGYKLDIREASYVIAANDSSLADYADVTCSGTNDQTIVNSVISDISTNGGKILLLDGTFHISGSVLPLSNIILSGIGWNTVIKASGLPDDDHLVHINNQSNVVVKDLQIDGNYPTKTTHYPGSGIRVENSQEITLDNLYVKDTKSHCFSFRSTSDSMIVGCVAENSGDDGIEVYNSSNNRVISNLSFNNTFNAGITRSGIEVEGNSFYNTISNNVCRNNLVGIEIESSYCTYEGNITLQNEKANIRLYGSNAFYNIISNNICYNSASYGLQLFNSCEKNTIIGNIINLNSTESIQIYRSHNNVIAFNIIANGSQSTDNTYANLRLLDTTVPSSSNLIAFNTFITDTANRVKYHINETGATDNLYMLNRFIGTPGTSDWSIIAPNKMLFSINKSIYTYRDQTTDVNGRISVTISPRLKEKPNISVVFEGNYLWYVYSWTTDANGKYTNVTIQVTDTGGIAVGSGITAHVYLDPRVP